jgi:3-isopropylmalate/(R)-2-methylmalate dehydratase large subunit
MATTPLTMFQKIWDRHVVARAPEGEELLFIDRSLIIEGAAFLGFDRMRIMGRTVRKPRQNIAITDHYLPTLNRAAGLAGIANPEIRRVIEMQEENALEFGIEHINMTDKRQGISHVIAGEQAMVLPGMLVTCNDSHTATSGALGAIAMPIGASNQLSHVLSTQTVWQQRPKMMRVNIEGIPPVGITSKDIILAVMAKLGIGGGAGHAIEYAGAAVRALSQEARMTICNMSVEAGARIGMIAPDDTTLNYLNGRASAPTGEQWEKGVVYWRTLPTDADAAFDKEVGVDVGDMIPMVSWGTSPEDSAPITGSVPEPASYDDPIQRQRVEQALEYMQIKPGTRFTDIPVNQVFIGSCTNSRIEDLRAAAAVLKGRKVVVPAMVSPGSTGVKKQAEAEGIDRIFTDSGFEWRDSSCSMCNGSNGDIVEPGSRSASTTNRNFEGRQGPGALTHIMSPPMVAAAAVTGKLTDVRSLVQ